MDQSEELHIDVHLHARYAVFDRSGTLPFSVAFGLCRRSPRDTDPRALVLDTARSALDVPYALKHKLLTLYEYVSEKDQVVVDTSKLSDTEGSRAAYIALPSPIGRKEKRTDAFTTHLSQIDATTELASLLAPGKKYTIRFATQDLGIRRHAFGDFEKLIGGDGKDSQPDGHEQLVRSYSKFSAGHVNFTAVASVSWPPEIQVRLRPSSSPPTTSSNTTESKRTLRIEVAITNGGDRSISIQARGLQRYLMPWGPFYPEDRSSPVQQLVIAESSESSSDISNIQVIDIESGAVIRGEGKPKTVLYKIPTDPRPLVSNMVVLQPAMPLIKHIDAAKILANLPDGHYGIRLRSGRAWWCHGSSADFSNEDDDKIPRHLWTTDVPPVLLESSDIVKVEIEDGRWSMEEDS